MVQTKLSTLFSKPEKEKALDIIENLINENYIIRNKNLTLRFEKKPLLKEIPSSKIIEALRNENLSYRKQNMLEDIRRLNATSQAKTTLKENRANIWFDNVYEEFRKENKLDSKRTSELWQYAKYQSAKLIEDAELSRNFWDMYKDVFKSDS